MKEQSDIIWQRRFEPLQTPADGKLEVILRYWAERITTVQNSKDGNLSETQYEDRVKSEVITLSGMVWGQVVLRGTELSYTESSATDVPSMEPLIASVRIDEIALSTILHHQANPGHEVLSELFTPVLVLHSSRDAEL